MKKIILLILFTNFLAFSQKELWGVNNQNVNGLAGIIGKYNINGENGSVVHTFNYNSNGNSPTSKLFMASNGKLYGTTVAGGLNSINNPQNAFGVLFEYDVILNKYSVKHNFIVGNSLSAYKSNFIEPVSGILFGAIGTKVYKYELSTATLTFLSGEADYFIINIAKGSDGYLYCRSISTSMCPGAAFIGNINPGTLIRVDMINNSIQKINQFSCDNTIYGAAGYTGPLLQPQINKFYSNNTYGGIPGNISGKGTLFEFNTLTNTLTKKIDFDGETMGENPVDLIDGGSGKLYGVCQNGGPAAQFWKKGTLFEYTIATNTINTLFNFGDTDSNGIDTFESPICLLKTSTGNLIGMLDQTAPFLYNLTTNQLKQTCIGNCGIYGLQNLIEICRKPSYQEFLVNTFTSEVGAAFNYNINNDNATTFFWKKGTTVLPLQITGNLNFASITFNDSGIYNCTMNNECGETITANLTINVSNLSIETIEDYRTLISLYPNPAKGNINLKYPENRGVKGLKYKITNLLGQIILENEIVHKPNMTEIIIETTGFANGVYQVTLTTDKGNWFGKFVKE